MALAELAAKQATEARKEILQEEAVAELIRNTRSNVAESQQQSESSEGSRDSNLAAPNTPGLTEQVITNLQEVASDIENPAIEEDNDDNDEKMQHSFSDSEEKNSNLKMRPLLL
jgi:hypothetical protein